MKNIEFLEKIIRQNSNSNNKEGVDKVGEMFATELSFMDIERIESKQKGDLFVFKSKINSSSKPSILLTGHSDTVHPILPEIPTVVDGNIIKGPGAQDMKGGLFIISETLKKLNEEGKLENITFILIPDEEIGSNAHKEKLVELYPEFDYGIVFEPTMQMVGVTSCDPLQRSIVVSRKGAGFIDIEISAPGGHSGVLTRKEDRISAITEASILIQKISELANYDIGTTVNVGLISGGIAHNVIASDCKLGMDFRVKSVSEGNRIQEEIKLLENKSSHPKIKISTKLHSYSPPMEDSELKENFVHIVEKVASELGIKIHIEHRGGGSDANIISKYVPAIIDGMGVQGDREHSPEEYIFLDSIQPGIDLAYKTILKLLS